MRKRHKQELERIQAALAAAKPGTPEYKELLEQRILFDDVMTKECNSTQLIPGVSNESLVNGALAGAEFAALTWGLDKFLVNKSLLNFLPKFHVKL